MYEYLNVSIVQCKITKNNKTKEDPHKRAPNHHKK